MDKSGLHAYIANAGNGKITVCNILQDGTGLLANCSITGGEYTGTGNIGFNDNGLYAYVPNELLDKVFACQVSPMMVVYQLVYHRVAQDLMPRQA